MHFLCVCIWNIVETFFVWRISSQALHFYTNLELIWVTEFRIWKLFFGQKFAFSSYNKFEGIFGPGIAFLMIMVSLEGGSGGFIVLTYMSHLCSLWYINDSHLIFATHSIQSDRQSNTHTHRHAQKYNNNNKPLDSPKNKCSISQTHIISFRSYFICLISFDLFKNSEKKIFFFLSFDLNAIYSIFYEYDPNTSEMKRTSPPSYEYEKTKTRKSINYNNKKMHRKYTSKKNL